MLFSEKPTNPGQRASWFIVSSDDGVIVGEIAKFSGRDHHVFKPLPGMVFKALEVGEIHGHMDSLR